MAVVITIIILKIIVTVNISHLLDGFLVHMSSEFQYIKAAVSTLRRFQTQKGNYSQTC